jgi:hypothetical protein
VKQNTPDEILRSFNTWAFKREQPDTIDILRATIERAVAAKSPIHFILYWGKGLRRSLDQADIQCLDFLSKMGHRIRETYAPGAAFTLILTDTHAALNGHPHVETAQYFREVSQSAVMRDFSTCILSRLVTAQGDMHAAHEEPDSQLLEKLQSCASRWYRADGSAISGAKKYYDMNMIEKAAVERAFPESVFITFNGSEMRSIFPDNLPIFYMYSLKRGTSVKPWFLPTVEETRRQFEIEPVA